MAIPSDLLSIIKGIPSHHFEKIPEYVPSLKTVVPKGKNLKSFFIEAIEKGDKDAIQALYDPMSIVLAAGGCCGGPVGIAFNSLDAAFCFILGKWFCFAIDILSIVLLFPGAKAGLIGISQLVKNLPKLLGKYCKHVINLSTMKSVIMRLKAAKQFEEKMVKELYDICSKFIQDKTETFNWLFLSHRETFNAIEKELKVWSGTDKISNVSSIVSPTASSNIGKDLVKTQEELKRAYDLSQRNIQPQTTISRYLFIKFYGN